MLTPEQKKLRLGRIGSSQIAALVGLSKFSRPIDVFREATDPTYEREPNEMLEIGTLLEPVVLELYRRRSGRETRPSETLPHPEFQFVVSTPDAFATGTADDPFDFRAVEAKTCLGFRAEEWGDGGDQVPPAYLCQAQWHLLVCRTLHPEGGFEACDLPVLIGGHDFRIYTVPYDAALAESLLRVAEKFWRDHILTGNPPPVDDSPAYADFLGSRFPEDRAPMLPATPAHEEWLAKLREAEAQKKAAESRYELARNNLRGLIGEAAGVQGALGTVTWKANKKGARVFRANWSEK